MQTIEEIMYKILHLYIKKSMLIFGIILYFNTISIISKEMNVNALSKALTFILEASDLSMEGKSVKSQKSKSKAVKLLRKNFKKWKIITSPIHCPFVKNGESNDFRIQLSCIKTTSYDDIVFSYLAKNQGYPNSKVTNNKVIEIIENLKNNSTFQAKIKLIPYIRNSVYEVASNSYMPPYIEIHVKFLKIYKIKNAVKEKEKTENNKMGPQEVLEKLKKGDEISREIIIEALEKLLNE